MRKVKNEGRKLVIKKRVKKILRVKKLKKSVDEIM